MVSCPFLRASSRLYFNLNHLLPLISGWMRSRRRIETDIFFVLKREEFNFWMIGIYSSTVLSLNLLHNVTTDFHRLRGSICVIRVNLRLITLAFLFPDIH